MVAACTWLIALVGVVALASEAPLDAYLSQAPTQELREICELTGVELEGVTDRDAVVAAIRAHEPTLSVIKVREYFSHRGPAPADSVIFEMGACMSGHADRPVRVRAPTDAGVAQEALTEGDVEFNDGANAAAPRSELGDVGDVPVDGDDGSSSSFGDDEIEIIDLDEDEMDDNELPGPEPGIEHVGSRSGQAASSRAQAAADPGAGGQGGFAEASPPEHPQPPVRVNVRPQPAAHAGSFGERTASLPDDPAAMDTYKRAVDGATSRFFLLLDSDHDLQVSPKDLVDGIVAAGELLLSTQGCTLRPGTSVSLGAIQAGVRRIFEACDQVRDARQPAFPGG